MSIDEIIDRLSDGDPADYGGNHPFRSLIATILSQNSQDTQSRAAYRRLREKFGHDDQEFLRNIQDAYDFEIAQSIHPCGPHRSKASYVMNAVDWIEENFDGDIDRFSLFVEQADEETVRETLTSITGVGRKTADVVLTFAAENTGVVAVDTHVHRVSNRLGIAEGGRNEVARSLTSRVEAPKGAQLHGLLISHGREVCKARNPRCDECSLEDLCEKRGIETED